MKNVDNKTDIASLFHDLNAGVFEQQVNQALSDIAANVCTHGKKGKLVLTFDLEQIGDTHQVKLRHSFKAMCPRMRGKTTEEYTVDTPLHVERGGRLSLFPSAETSQLDLGAGAATGRTDGVRHNG